MSVSPISTSAYPPIHRYNMRQDLQATQNALQAGDLDKAQRTFAEFKRDFHATHQGRALFQTDVPTNIQDDLRGLQSALKSGDLTAAQQAFATFRQDVTAYLRPTEPPIVQPPQSSEGAGVNVVA